MVKKYRKDKSFYTFYYNNDEQLTNAKKKYNLTDEHEIVEKLGWVEVEKPIEPEKPIKPKKPKEKE